MKQYYKNKLFENNQKRFYQKTNEKEEISDTRKRKYKRICEKHMSKFGEAQ